MQQSHNFGAVYGGDQHKTAWLITALATALSLGLGGLLLLAQPALSDTAHTLVQQRVGDTMTPWAVPTIMLGLSIGIAGAGVFMLAGFVHGARRRPFLMLAPLLCALSIAVLGHLPLELSMGPLGSANFALPALLLALGGASIFQLRGPLPKIAGVLVWLLPAALLLGGATSYQDGWSPAALLSPQKHPLTAILVLSWVALAVIACIAPDARDTVPLPIMRRRISALEQQLAEAQERVRVLSSSPGQANQIALRTARQTITHLQGQLAQAEQQTLQNTNLREDLLTTQAKLRRLEATAILGNSKFTSYFWLFALLAGTAVGTTAAGYLVHLRPMQTRLSTRTQDALTANHRVAALRQQLVKQQRESSAALSALQGELTQLRETHAHSTPTSSSKERARSKVNRQGREPTGEHKLPSPPQAHHPSVTLERPTQTSTPKVSPDRNMAQPQSPPQTQVEEVKPQPPPENTRPKPSATKKDSLEGFLNDDDPLGGL